MHPARAVASLSAVMVIGTVAHLPTATATPPEPQRLQPSVADDAKRFLQRPANGATALDRLGDRLAQVAAINEMSPRALRQLLLDDETAWVHPVGLIYYVEPAPEAIEPETAESAPFPYDQTFALHSKPGASKTIYLDFNGETVSGTAWNELAAYQLQGQAHPAFSLDSIAAFTDAERDIVQGVWQRVSEDYAPFDVDVTTQDPGIDALRRTDSSDTTFGTRVLITPSLAAPAKVCGGECGGSAFMGVFNVTANQLSNMVGKTVAGSDYVHPAWVFPHNLGNDAKAIADATSHEVGHNLGLDHDGNATVGYYEGHGAWAPIMGSSYYRPIAQWSIGEYTGANNLQDDLAVITQHGLAPQVDDHSNGVTGATPLMSAGGPVPGIITTRGDKDYFALPQGCAGNVTVSVDPAPTSPNLDVQLRVLRGDGTVAASNDPASAFSAEDFATGMGASTTVSAVAGTPLFVEVDGVGARNAATDGYSDYASIGRYTVTSPGCGGASEDPGVVAFQQSAQSAGEGTGQALLTVVRTGNTAVAGSVSYAHTGGTANPGSDFAPASGTVNFAATETEKTIPITIIDDTVDEGDETIEIALSAPAAGTALGTVNVTTVTITDDDEPAAAQPDLLISTRKARGYIGDDVYNRNGSGQTKQLAAARGRLRSFFVEITNDGAAPELITVFGTKPKGAKVTYWNEGVDLTRSLTGSGGTVTLAPDEFALLRVDIKIGRTARIGSFKSALVSATSTGGRRDAVKATVKVVKG